MLAPVSAPPRPAPCLSIPVERLPKPASWLVVALIGWSWLRLESAQGPWLVFAAGVALAAMVAPNRID